jgi:hypothetical protein
VPTQRLSLTQAATASATGTATFTFPAPPTDLVYLGTLVCNGAPAGATFIATVGGTQWGSWNGTAVGGPIQALPGEQVQISATGLTASSAYNLQWIGRSDSLSETSPAYPDTNTAVASQAPGNPVQVVALVGGASQATATNVGAGSSLLLPAPATGAAYNLRHVTFVLGSGATQVEIVGHTSGFIYTASFSSSAVLDNMAGQIATEELDFTTIGGGGSVYLTYDLGVPTVPGGTSGGGGGVLTNFEISHSYAVPGVVAAQTLPGFFIPVPAGQTVTLVAIRCVLQAGTSIALALQQNGVNIGGLGAVSVTTGAATTLPTAPVTIANNDEIQAVLSSAVGNPTGLTISVYVVVT